MATKKDLVEAHAFSRRRLVTAFVSGAPGGREVEPTRPLRAVFGGLALSVLLLAGAAVLGFFKPTTPEDWLDPGNLIASKSGSLYLVREAGGKPELRPFTNAMSARILLGNTDTIEATSAKIAGVPKGPQIGYYAPPSEVAPRSELIQSGWTACTGDGRGISLDLSATPPGEVVDGGAEVVADGKGTYLVTDRGRPPSSSDPVQAAAFPLSGTVGSLLAQLGLDPSPVEVDATWLGLFPLGDPVTPTSFDVGRRGAALSYAAELGSNAFRAGQLVTRSGQTYLLTTSGVALLTPFAADVYIALVEPRASVAVTSLPARLRDGAFPASWPTSDVTPALGNACARMETAVDGAPTVRVVSDPSSVERVAAAPVGAIVASVEPGHGALVRSGTFGSGAGSGSYLVDDEARTYAITDPSETTRANLGYEGLDQPVVPDTWLRLMSVGQELSAQSAGLSPGTQG